MRRRCYFYSAITLFLMVTLVLNWRTVLYLGAEDNDGELMIVDLLRDGDGGPNNLATNRPKDVRNRELQLRMAAKQQMLDKEKQIQIEREKSKCREKKHVIYIRIPKTGSSTLTVLLWNFAWRRKLGVLMTRVPERHHSTLQKSTHHLPPKGILCDVMANHVIYDPLNYAPYFPRDTVYFSLIRDPMEHINSIVNCYPPIINVSGPPETKLNTYLKYPRNFTLKVHEWDVTRNPMMTYFGLPQFLYHDRRKVNALIKAIDKKFALVLILEKLSESLVLLKRKLCWKTRDIIYMAINANSKKPPVNVKSPEVERLHQWSSADYQLYEYFTTKLKKLIQAEDNGFEEEVSNFKIIRKKIEEFCRKEVHIFTKRGNELEEFCNRYSNSSILHFPESVYNEGFSATSEDCCFLITHSTVQRELRKKQATLKFGCR